MKFDAPGLLFLGVANSARSQMAEALARARFGDRARIRSAGSEPAALLKEAVACLAERGISMEGQRSKGVAEIDPEEIDVVVTLSAEERCPTWLEPVTRLHWPFPDPADPSLSPEARRARLREVRDGIDERLRELSDLLPPPRSTLVPGEEQRH